MGDRTTCLISAIRLPDLHIKPKVRAAGKQIIISPVDIKIINREESASQKFSRYAAPPIIHASNGIKKGNSWINSIILLFFKYFLKSSIVM